MKDCIVIVNRAYTKKGALVSVKWINGYIWICYAKGGRYKFNNEYYSKEEIHNIEIGLIAGISGMGLRLF